ncbi:MAG: aminopeptidase P family protein [Candidatus Eisenbacteria bacterium]|uniref:Aminopeptidase P family protein n=1 Tax=Eiseniibacteriota bacterium TaxID=2212470 RepID=A0A538TKM4_UNCEI|nr:MAG: aminopeptidase P family protein [Candidatus Eisenbacteria bacterium]
MRRDLDHLMQERGLSGLVVFAYDRYTPAMYYATGQKLHYAIYMRAADGRAHLIHDPMERDQAAHVGCDHSTFPQHGLQARLEKEGHPARAFGGLIADTCAALGMTGRIPFFGELPSGFAYEMLEHVRHVDAAIEIDRSHPDILTAARATKSEDELERIRHAAKGTVAGIARLREHLQSLRKDGDHFRANGSGWVRLGDLRRLLHTEFLAHGLEGGESIVSQGRDAGVPHNRGNDDEPLQAGAPLLVDIFPGEVGGGYFSDLTRTFCMGKAPEPLRALYGDVRDAFELAMSTLKAGEPCRSYQEKVCELFEQRGHATLRTNETADEGYVHGLGHGVGLAVHEAPRLGGPPSNVQTLDPGMVVTIEPGLYYPSRGLGVRIEDLVVIGPDGRIENLTPAPYELEIEPRG